MKHLKPIAVGCVMTLCLIAHAVSFRNVHSFGVLPNQTGVNPSAPLVTAPDGTLYGVMYAGGSGSGGTVFKVNANGTGFTVLHNFTGSDDGAYPESGLVMAGNTLFGTTTYAGTGGVGTIFKVNTDGSGFTNLHSFAAVDAGGINNGGASPIGNLALSGTDLFGTTLNGGSSGYGTVYKINTNGTVFSTLYEFTGGGDGGFPDAGLILSGSTLYMTTDTGGLGFYGTVFKINTSGSSPAVVYNFTGGSDGADLKAALVLSGTNLYGVAATGGKFGFGTVFQVNTIGTFFTNLYDFTGGSDGSAVEAALTLSGNTFYGTASYGGSGGVGTVFKLNTNGTGFSLLHSFSSLPQSKTNGDGAFPFSGVVISGGTLYGLTTLGGTGSGGVLFSVNTNSTAFTNLLSFNGSTPGGFSTASLIAASNTLYGTTPEGGSGQAGTIFKVTPDGSGYTTLYSFSPVSLSSSGANSDGATPTAALLLSGTNLYGTTYEGGTGDGTIFKFNLNSSTLTTLHSFSGLDGSSPRAGLVLAGNSLYGTTQIGGEGFGGIFRFNTDTSTFTNFYTFTSPIPPDGTNSDGDTSVASLVSDGNVLYGTTSEGGEGGGGTIFKVNTNGTSFVTLHSFPKLSGSATNTDGFAPLAGLTLIGNTLYGTTSTGGFFGKGTIFLLSTNGNIFIPLHHFTGGSDGANPNADLNFSGGLLYGTTTLGGSGNNGTVFSITPAGTGYTNLYNFTARSLQIKGTNNDGAFPQAGVILIGGTIYGTTFQGGSFGEGTLFALDSTPLLSIRPISHAVVLSWDDPAFALQSSTNVSGNYVTISGATSPHTNTITSPEIFFRLQGN